MLSYLYSLYHILFPILSYFQNKYNNNVIFHHVHITIFNYACIVHVSVPYFHTNLPLTFNLDLPPFKTTESARRFSWKWKVIPYMAPLYLKLLELLNHIRYFWDYVYFASHFFHEKILLNPGRRGHLIYLTHKYRLGFFSVKYCQLTLYQLTLYKG